MHVPKLPIPFLVFAFAPFVAHAQSATSVEGLRQDVAALRDEVAKLRGEIEDLRTAQENAAKSASKTSDAGSAATTSRLNAVESAVSVAVSKKADRSELAALDAKIERLAANTDKALAEQTRQVNAALRSVVAKPAATPVEPKTPAALPADMPKTGVRYTVLRGDSVTRIAKKMNSKPAWILAANGLKSNADLKADAVIFVPQPEGN